MTALAVVVWAVLAVAYGVLAVEVVFLHGRVRDHTSELGMHQAGLREFREWRQRAFPSPVPVRNRPASLINPPPLVGPPPARVEITPEKLREADPDAARRAAMTDALEQRAAQRRSDSDD